MQSTFLPLFKPVRVRDTLWLFPGMRALLVIGTFLSFILRWMV
jgi:hypothetical protein